MKTYTKRTEDILIKAKKIRKKRNVLVTGICSVAIILGVFLFAPYDNTPPSIAKYKGSEYFELISKLNAITYHAPQYENNFEKWVLAPLMNFTSLKGGAISDGNFNGGANMDIGMDVDMNLGLPEADAESSLDAPSSQAPENPSDSYEEITDNQVLEVIEGDRIKRSNKYIYYLSNKQLNIYTIDGENSVLAGSFPIKDANGYQFSAYADEWEMFLSNDCTTITLVSSCFNHELKQRYVSLVSIDVTDPANIKENGRTYLTGNYITARLVDGKIILISEFSVANNPDFSDKKNFIPQYGTADNMTYVLADKIVIPEELTTSRYTVVCKIDEKTLKADDTAAFLSYTNQIYVSDSKIYATRPYQKEESKDNVIISQDMTEISIMSYSGDLFEYLGSATVAGTLNDQYSMDEYEGILRVVTTTTSHTETYPEGYTKQTAYNSAADMMVSYQFNESASLYCIDLSTLKIVAQVENFAPQGESVRSVRFDKNLAYVCTAIVLTDPVFVFDLSDLNNITYKDTGTIKGYSFSLVNFADNYLLGIGYGSSMETLKIELYTETDTALESVCSYEVEYCSFATDYKAIYINRDNGFVGIGYLKHVSDSSDSQDARNRYVLLHFDGYELVELVNVPLEGEQNLKRSVYIDGYLYMFGEGFVVQAI